MHGNDGMGDLRQLSNSEVILKLRHRVCILGATAQSFKRVNHPLATRRTRQDSIFHGYYGDEYVLTTDHMSFLRLLVKEDGMIRSNFFFLPRIEPLSSLICTSNSPQASPAAICRQGPGCTVGISSCNKYNMLCHVPEEEDKKKCFVQVISRTRYHGKSNYIPWEAKHHSAHFCSYDPGTMHYAVNFQGLWL